MTVPGSAATRGLHFDVVVIGAGAAGLHCAAMAGQRGLKALLLDHADKVAEKIRISGGGRCNFTNREVGPANFLSDNPHFCRSALARYPSAEFIALVQRHGIAFHEKHRGQLFCDGSSQQIIDLLLAECQFGGVTHWQPCAVSAIQTQGHGFVLDTARGQVQTSELVVATGGLSIPKLGASDFGHRLAKQFGHQIVPLRPALVPLTFSNDQWAPFAALSGLALEVDIRTGHGASAGRFREDLLFTHRGLSGPAVLQISSHWQPGQALHINLAAGLELGPRLQAAKSGSRRLLGNELGQHLPQRLADTWLALHGPRADLAMPQHKDRDLQALAQGLSEWVVQPMGSEGWRKAEVTAGGVDTRELDSRSMQSRLQPGLYFIGEVVDVTGWLGGYNFQWAWASAAACAKALSTPSASAQ